jgi:hypothetical protein
MQYAKIDGLRCTAQPKLKAICEHCNSAVHAKCGSKVVWHWAHVSVENCDSWYEPETQWHRNWKNNFGQDRSEISIVKDGVMHIADVLTKDDLVIEFQNSNISSETIMARELFYDKMIWVINGIHFKENFTFWDKDFAENWQLKTEIIQNLNLLNSNVYYSWYERILPNYADPYLDFIDTSLGLTRQNIIFDIQSEYDKFSHLEDKSLIPEGLSFGSSLSQSQRIDDDIYGFYSKNRYNTPFPQSWEYLGLSADTRLSNVVWQNQFDLDDEVYPEILYAYDKLIKKSLITNREKYTKLKNAKRKWEV